jgi:hypothetical protein
MKLAYFLKPYLKSRCWMTLGTREMLDDLGDERGRRNSKEEAVDHIALAVDVAVHLPLRQTAR